MELPTRNSFFFKVQNTHSLRVITGQHDAKKQCRKCSNGNNHLEALDKGKNCNSKILKGNVAWSKATEGVLSPPSCSSEE